MLSGEARLLLLCARTKLSDAERTVLRQLIEQGVDWDAVLVAAKSNFVQVLVRRHVLDAAADRVPAGVLVELDRLRTFSTMRAMEVVRIQHMLVKEILDPGAIRHVFVKGASLSQRYYGDVFLRQYRDIDVLVEARSLATIGYALQSRGYVVTNPEWDGFGVQDLAAFCRFTCALEMRSPTGVLIEIHRTLDNTGCVFSTRAYLAAAITSSCGDKPIKVLPTAELFVYLCFHHSRHYWSSLHWCADLPALGEDPEYAPERVMQLARQAGMEGLVRECLTLRRNLQALGLHGNLPAGEDASRLLADCLQAIETSLAPTDSMDSAAHDDELLEPDFRYPWQKSLGYRWRFQWARWHPSTNDYNALPLPLRWHWLYYLIKPFRVLWLHWRKPRLAHS